MADAIHTDKTLSMHRRALRALSLAGDVGLDVFGRAKDVPIVQLSLGWLMDNGYAERYADEDKWSYRLRLTAKGTAEAALVPAETPR